MITEPVFKNITISEDMKPVTIDDSNREHQGSFLDSGNPFIIQCPSFITELYDNTQDFRMGKLLVRESGKIQMQIGDIVFDLSQGISTSFYQNLTCVNSQNEMINLGEICEKLMLTSNIDFLK